MSEGKAVDHLAYLEAAETSHGVARYARSTMIDVNCESLLTLTEAAKRLPSRRPGKSPHVATLYRWASRGVRGVVLDTVRIVGTGFTSVEAVGRFSRALTERSAVPRVGGPRCGAPAGSRRGRPGEARCLTTRPGSTCSAVGRRVRTK